jgi:hypothetical protein
MAKLMIPYGHPADPAYEDCYELVVRLRPAKVIASFNMIS